MLLTVANMHSPLVTCVHKSRHSASFQRRSPMWQHAHHGWISHCLYTTRKMKPDSMHANSSNIGLMWSCVKQNALICFQEVTPSWAGSPRENWSGFLQASFPCCHPLNRVKTLAGIKRTWQTLVKQNRMLHFINTAGNKDFQEQAQKVAWQAKNPAKKQTLKTFSHTTVLHVMFSYYLYIPLPFPWAGGEQILLQIHRVQWGREAAVSEQPSTQYRTTSALCRQSSVQECLREPESLCSHRRTRRE